MPMKYLKVFYDWPEVTKYLKPAQKGELIDALVRYARGETDVESSLKGAALMMFPGFKRQIDQDAEQYAEQTERNRENGKKGGRPKKETQENPENPVGFSETQVVFEKTEKSQDKEQRQRTKTKNKDEDTLFKKNIDSNYKHSRRARAAAAQVVVDQIVGDGLPAAGCSELYDLVLNYLDCGVTPERIYAEARECTSALEISPRLYMAKKELEANG